MPEFLPELKRLNQTSDEGGMLGALNERDRAAFLFLYGDRIAALVEAVDEFFAADSAMLSALKERELSDCDEEIKAVASAKQKMEEALAALDGEPQ